MLNYNFIPGKRWESSFKLNHLTPIHLDITLPHGYPSDKPPSYTVECVWLEAHQLALLCAQLDALWGEAQNCAVMFTWLDYLQNNTFRLVMILS